MDEARFVLSHPFRDETAERTGHPAPVVVLTSPGTWAFGRSAPERRRGIGGSGVAA